MKRLTLHRIASSLLVPSFGWMAAQGRKLCKKNWQQYGKYEQENERVQN
jgi:hypothetical protein